MKKKFYLLFLLLVLAAGTTAVLFWYLRGGNRMQKIIRQASASHIQASSPRFTYVAIVLEENNSYEKVIGNPGMPYFNFLANRYGLATQYYSNQHNSLVNYMWLTAGLPVTTDQSKTGFDVDNIFGRVMAAGDTWKAYQQSLPEPGFTALQYGKYLRRHNPAAYFTDTTTAQEKNNIVPAGELAQDIASGTLPNFMFITPDADNDAHDGTLAQADVWLKANIAPLINNPLFAQNGLLIITFDEGNIKSDKRHGGGRVATLLISPKVKPGYKSTTLYQGQNILREMCDALGFQTCPGQANTAKSMAEFFQ